jgi:transcriptional regulator with XRE-family HTH domain
VDAELQRRLDATGVVLDANVRARARRLGLSMASIATLSGISRSHLYAVLDGTKRPRLDTLLRIAIALDTEVWALLKPPRRRRSAK